MIESPYGILVKAGERIGIRVKCADDDVPKDNLELIGIGHVSRKTTAEISVHHNAEHPSHLLLPITKGNRIAAFLSGEKLPPLPKK
jgi:uncharacterized protein